MLRLDVIEWYQDKQDYYLNCLITQGITIM